MSKVKSTINSSNTPKPTSYKNYAKPSKEPNDGYFIEKDPNDSFSSEGTVRYGEEQDVDDL